MCYRNDCIGLLFNSKNPGIKYADLCQRGNDTFLYLCDLFWTSGFLFSSSSAKKKSYQLSELEQAGVALSAIAKNTIDRFGQTAAMGPAPLAPDAPSIVIWATIAFMFIGGIGFTYPENK